MFSAWQGRMVLVDFGLAKAVKEDIAGKTVTRFRGTRGWVEEDMEVLSQGRTTGPVNLYRNDLHMLSKSAKAINRRYVQCSSLC